MIYKTLASTLAISVAMTTTAFAQEKSTPKPTTPQAEEAQPKAEAGPLALGLGAIIAIGAVNQEADGEDRLTENVSIAAPGSGAGKANFQDLSSAKETTDLKLGPIKGESQDKAKDKATVDGGGGGAGKVNVQDISIIKYATDPKIGDIRGESQDKAMAEKFAPLAGAALANEACVTEAGDVDVDCNGVADDAATAIDRRDIRKRPEPRQQRR